MTIYSTKKEMDKQLLRPRELFVVPGAPDARRVFAFWFRTAEDFIHNLRELRRDGDPEVNRKRIIINCFSPSVYPCVEDAADYEDVVRILKSLYVKQKNNGYARHLLPHARHLLVSRHQLQGELCPSICKCLNLWQRIARSLK